MKSCIINLNVYLISFISFFGNKTVFSNRAAHILNVNVLHKGVLLQDWVFRQGVSTTNVGILTL